jgi:hypothetical protein
MTDYRAILKRIGFVLISLVIANIVYETYRAFTNQRFSLNLNLLAIVVGIFLIQGGLKTARIVTWLTAFTLVFSIGLMLLTVFQKPLHFWAIEFRLDAVGTIGVAIWSIALLALLIWMYVQLRSPVVITARQAVGQTTAPPKLAFALGGAMALLIGVATHFALNGDAATKAIALAKTQYGADYQYQVKSISWRGNQASATLTAYNEREMKTVNVAW